MAKRLHGMTALLRLCWKPLFLFELLYKLFSAALLAAYVYLAFHAATAVCGYSYITLENLSDFMRHPLVLLLLLLLLLLIALLTLPDVGASVYAFGRAAEGKRPHFLHLVGVIFIGLRRVFRQRDLGLLLHSVLQLPTLCIGVTLAFLFSTKLWGILGSVLAQRPWLLLALLPLLLLVLWSLRRLYVPHFCFLAGERYREARRSDRGVGGPRFPELVLLVLLQLCLAIVALAFLLLGLTLAKLLGLLLEEGFLLSWLSSALISALLLFVFSVLSALSLPLRYGLIASFLSCRLAEKGLPPLKIAEKKKVPDLKTEILLRRVLVALGCVGGAACLLFGFLLGEGIINPSVEHLRETEITAHRGASALAPENTMAAFRLAEELGADWIELDVQECADGEIVVMHDSNFARTVGLRANVWELTWPEIAELDAGSRFSPLYAGERIPLLREVLDFARDSGVRLNIELKPTGRERELERSVARLVREYGMEERCVITSQVYAVLERVKAVAPELETVYVMGLAYGDLSRMTAADAFSIQAASITRPLVKRVHNAGKEILAWTVNSADAIDRMLSRGVDNVITDDIELALERVSESRYSSWVREYLAIFN